MAVKTFKTSQISVLALALAALAVPAMAQAQSDPDRERPSWRGNSEQGRAPRSDGGSGWQRPAPAPQSNAPSGRSNPAPSVQAAPSAQPPQSRSAWGNAGGNARNWEGRGNRENVQGRGNGDDRSEGRRGGEDRTEGRDRDRGPSWRGGSTRVATTPTGQVTAPPAPLRSTSWTGSGDRPRRDGDRVRDRDDHGRDGRGDSWRDRDGRRDGDSWRDRDGRRDGDSWRSGDRRTSWNSGSDRNDHHRWDRRWRDNNRYNWHSYRSRYPSYFSVGIYYSPYRHYRYQRLNSGHFLDALFYSDRYWISDPWYYRLPDAYGPYRWVRYYDDALLVNIYTGEVVDVIHRFFW